LSALLGVGGRDSQSFGGDTQLLESVSHADCPRQVVTSWMGCTFTTRVVSVLLSGLACTVVLANACVDTRTWSLKRILMTKAGTSSGKSDCMIFGTL
jgi:hypothetical protein